MNLELETDEMEMMMDFCLEQKLNIAMISLGVNTIPPQYGKLLNVLMNRISNEKMEEKEKY